MNLRLPYCDSYAEPKFPLEGRRHLGGDMLS